MNVLDLLVDSGAAELALPAELIDALNLEELGDVRVFTRSSAANTTTG